MSYPTAWRHGRPSGTGRAATGAGFGVRLPARGTWYMPPRRRPPLGPYARMGFALGLVIGVLWQPPQPQLPVPEGSGARPYDWSGWTLICGPTPSPTPSVHGETMAWKFYGPGGGCATPQCTLAGQSVTLPFDNATAIPAPGADCARLWQGPAPALLPLRRYYLVEQRSRPGGGPVPIPVSVPSVIPGLVPAVAVGQPVTRPGLVSVGVAPIPVPLVPYLPLPILPEQSVRGYRCPPLGVPPVGIEVRDNIADAPKPGSRGERPPRVVPVPGFVDVKPATPDREVKLADASGRMAALFKTLSVYGSANGVIDALWRSLPAYARTRSARTDQKYADVLAAFARGEVNADAFGNALAYWLNYKAAGALFGTAFRAAEGIGAGGYQLYRAWATGEYVGEGISDLSFDVAFGGYRETPTSNYRRPGPQQVGYQRVRHIAARYDRQRRAIERAFALQSYSRAGRTRTRALAEATRRRRLRQLNSWRREALAGRGSWRGPGWRV